jgi:hypothetical protein
MSGRAAQLHSTADAQIAELTDFVTALDDAALRRPCPGREKLGDGTVAANAQHTADNYQRIAAFVQTGGRMSAADEHAPPGAHWIPGFLRRLGHRPPDQSGHGTGPHRNQYTADGIDSAELVKHLSASRQALEQIAVLTDSQLDSIPPEGSFRFCDGQRTLEQVMTSLLKHQGHQLQALKASLE